jgi:subtilisin family serine protease
MSENNEFCYLLPYVKEDIFMMQTSAQQVGWHVSGYNIPELWKITQGENVTVAVIDSGCDLEHVDLKSSLIPGKNFVEDNLPPEDAGDHGCVSADALIQTNLNGIQTIESFYDTIDCAEKEIKTIDGTYFVKTLDNIKTLSYDVESKKTVLSQIQSVQKLRINSEIIKITLDGGTEFKLTPWHPVYTIKHKTHGRIDVIRKRADEVNCNDNFIFGNGDFEEKIKIILPEIFVCANCKHTPAYHIGENPSKCKKCYKSCWTIYNDEIEIDEDLAYLCGIVLTDGHMQPGSYRFEVTSITVQILEKIRKIAEKRNWNYKIEEKRILVYGKTPVNLLEKMGVSIGKKSLIQNLPAWVGKASRNLVCSFLAGVIDGDGCVSTTNTRNRIISASYEFSNKLSALLNSIGLSSIVIGPIFDTRKRFIQSKNPIYHVQFSSIKEEIYQYLSHPKKIERSKVTPKGCRKSRTVVSVEKIKYDGYFYDFTVAKYHNYIANGHFVSNTHCSGIIAANNNDYGVVGVAPNCKIMPIKVLNSFGMGSLEHVEKAIYYAVDNGADIITMSLGARNPVENIKKAMQYANEKKVVCFVAAGNAGSTKNLLYPAAYSECISIGAVDENSMRADFSCTGPNLDFVAPGVKIFSTVPKNSYAFLSGTSMSCPFVVGVAALVLSERKQYDKNAKISIEEYREILKSNSLSIKNLDQNLDQQGKRFWQGMGIINPSEFEEWTKYRTIEEVKRDLIVINDKLTIIKDKALLDSIKPQLELINSKILTN